MRIAFLGTPEFAVASLLALHARGDEIFVFTQPDRPVGRHAALTPPPVKAEALRLGLPVYQFERMRSGEAQACLAATAPDIMVTAAFGQLLSAENLAVPHLGCINVHASLLPHLRGASPVQWAIVNGDEVTGVTIMKTVEALDAGDILSQRELKIDPNENAASLMARLSALGAELLVDTLADIESGAVVAKEQDAALATYCRQIRKEQAAVDFSCTAKQVHDLVRGMNPWPAAHCEALGETVKLWRTEVTDIPAVGGCGKCVAADAVNGLLVNASDFAVRILELQFPGGKRQTAEACINGRRLLGEVFK